MPKKIIFLFIIYFMVVSMTIGHIALSAQQESDDTSKALFESVKSALTWAIGIAVGLAGVMFAYGAVRYMFFADGEGKDAMFKSVLGLALALASFLIIQRINPTLINPLNLQALPATGNVFLEKANGDRAPTGLYFELTQKIIDEDYTGIFYDCVNLEPAKTPRLLISPTVYNPNNTSMPSIGLGTLQMECNKRAPLPPLGGSHTKMIISMAFEYPGVYFYTDEKCGGPKSSYTGPWKDHISNFQDPLTNNVKCMIFYTGEGPNKHFALFPTETPNILNGDGSFKPGKPCGGYYSDLKPERTPIPVEYCKNSIKSALIFYQPDNPNVAGNEIIFYSKPNGETDNKAGQFKITFEEFEQVQNGLVKDPSQMKFQYQNQNLNDPDQKRCQTFKDKGCQGSIKITGNYLVSLESKSNDKKQIWDKSTIQSINNLNIEEAFPAQYPDFFQVFILPILR